MGQRTGQLLRALRVYCEAERGRQAKVSHILQVDPSVLAKWFNGRRNLTGEQALIVQDLVRTIANLEKPTGDNARVPNDSILALHESLEDKDTKTVWVRPVSDHLHIILAGPARDRAFARMKELIQKDRILAEIIKNR
jgi:hypothetical protein